MSLKGQQQQKGKFSHWDGPADNGRRRAVHQRAAAKAAPAAVTGAS
jgi:hypothetical protein